MEVALIYLLKRSLDPVLGKTTGRQREEMTIYKSQKEASAETNSAKTLILDI